MDSPGRHISFRTTATAWLLTLAWLLAGPGVAHAKVLYSLVLSTGNGTGTFHCSFTNIHPRNTAGIAFFIFDYVTEHIVLEDSLFLGPLESTSFHVNGPGAFICVINTIGSKVQS
jgi:hypothetical protein